MTAAVVGASRLPFVPPPQPGETLPSWMDRVAAANDLPLGFVLHRTGLADTTHHDDVPTAYGVTLADRRVDAVSRATGVASEQVRATLLAAYDGGPVDLTGLDLADPASVTAVLRAQWAYATGSHYCPDCLRESGGAWQLAWRLPWSFACTRHQQLLVADCPACGRRAAQPRQDGRASPTFLTRIPAPGQCGNATPTAGVGPRGRGGQPCGHDLTTVPAIPLDSRAAQPVLAVQAHLDNLLADDPDRQFWCDLRALTAAVLTVGDEPTLTRLAAHGNLRHLTLRPLTAAVAEHAEHRDERRDARLRVIDGGRDGRTGPRLRMWTTTPTSPALMAAVAPLTALADPGSPVLADLAAVCRARRRHLPTLLTSGRASGDLIDAARNAGLTTGRHAHQIRSRTSTATVEPRHVPAYLAERNAEPILTAFSGTGTREDTARKFASINLVMALTGDTYRDAAVRLGHNPDTIGTLAANLVNRLNEAGTLTAFRDAIQALPDKIAAEPLVDYSARRRALRTLRTVPADLLRPHSPVVTKSRRRNAAAWLWADLTGGHPYDAPAWGSVSATENQREVYRRFTRDHLAAVRDHLTSYGQVLVATAADGPETP